MFKYGLSLAFALSAAVLLGEMRLQVGAVDQCLFNSGCPGIKYCCRPTGLFSDNVCEFDCIGKSCDSDSDCGPPGECCRSNICTTACFDDVAKALATWIIVVIVVGVLLVVVLPVSIAIFCCCCAASAARRPAQRGVILTQPGQAGPTVVAMQNSQVQSGPMPYQSPPPFQNPPGYMNQGLPPPSQQSDVPPPVYKAQF